LNIYARSKWEGEEALRKELPERHLILRTAWVYGPDPARRNFILRLIDQLMEGKGVPVPMDQWGTPTFTEDIACATRFLLEKGCAGIFHAVGPDFLSRYELAKKVCERFGLDEKLLLPKSTQGLKQPALRPLRVRLNTAKLRSLGFPPFPGIEAGLEKVKAWTLSHIKP